MQSNPFNNLPKINKEDAIKILKKTISEVNFSVDCYKAVFSLANFPCKESEDVLINFIKLDFDRLEFKIAKRKAVEVLAIFGCKKAIPFIAKLLLNDDPYLVETAVWSLARLKCNDLFIINQICSILHNQFDNKRVVIQALTSLGIKKEIDTIRLLYEDQQSSNGVRGASLAALIKLAGDKDKLNELKDFLRLSNQNDRHCAVQDIVSAGSISLIPALIEAPVSPSFKIQAIDSLWLDEISFKENINVINSLDYIIIDDPKNINTLEIKNFEENINFLINQLFHTDFNRCYKSMKELLNHPLEEVLYHLNSNWDRAKFDYGALYFFINLYKILLKKGVYDQSLFEKVRFLLSDNWPDYIKFKSSAIQVLGCLDDIKSFNDFHQFSDERLTPYWKNRYSSLLAFQNKEYHIKIDFSKLFLNDKNRFVRLKAKQICFQ